MCSKPINSLFLFMNIVWYSILYRTDILSVNMSIGSPYRAANQEEVWSMHFIIKIPWFENKISFCNITKLTGYLRKRIY